MDRNESGRKQIICSKLRRIRIFQMDNNVHLIVSHYSNRRLFNTFRSNTLESMIDEGQYLAIIWALFTYLTFVLAILYQSSLHACSNAKKNYSFAIASQTSS